MPSERVEGIRHQLEAIAEELADMAMASLRGALEGGEERDGGLADEASARRAGRSVGAPAAVGGAKAGVAEERVLTNARRAVLKAANLLATMAGTPYEGSS